MCCCKVEELIYNACRNIERTCGKYTEVKCKQKVDELQKYLLANLPVGVLDDLQEFRGKRRRHRKDDHRIETAVYIHRSIRTFLVNRFFQASSSNVDTQFLAMQLSKLKNLVVLDLHLACTDKVLEAVGVCCQMLTYIDIVVVYEPTYVRDPNRFNALRPKYALTDKGLGYLCKCKLLRKIRMNRDLYTDYGEMPVTLGGIRRLLKSLPLLQHVTFDDMGMVLADEIEDVRRLSLTCLSDFHPRPAHFSKVAKLCPNLKQLSLRFFKTKHPLTEANVLQALASSGVKVSELQLIDFSFSLHLFRVIETNGCYLNSLAIENMGRITAKTIELIGRKCPNLINLLLSEEACIGLTFSWQNPQYSNTRPDRGFLGNLQYLTLSGRTWKPEDILPLCLSSATELQTLKINSRNKEGSLDAAIKQIIETNPLHELTEIYFETRSEMTIETLQYFLRNCPGLREVFFLKNPSITQEQVDLLCAEMLKQNCIFKNIFR